MKMNDIKLFVLALVTGLFIASCDDKGGSGGDDATTETEVVEDEVAATVDTFHVATDGAAIRWTASKEEGTHIGSLNLSSGSIEVVDGSITGGRANIDLSSIKVMDEGLDEETKGKLTGHLSSEDFFNIAEFPSITVTIVGSEAYSGTVETIPEGVPEQLGEYFVASPTHNIMAVLNIKGEEHEISFPASIKLGDGLDAIAFISFDRRDYGLRFMSDTEATVNPTIHLGLKFSAVKRPS